MHDKVHEENSETRGSVRISRGLQLRSLHLGVIGVADVVEFHKDEKVFWRPYPVEYKRGKPKPDLCDIIQLCAQALCLEEMLGSAVPEGALFYGKVRRRSVVLFDEKLRRQTQETAECTLDLIRSGITPPPEYARRCKSCSLVDECLPGKMQKPSVARYLARMTAGDI